MKKFTKTIKNILKKTGSYVTGIATLMTIESYIKNINNQDLKNKYNTQLERNNELENQVHQLLENQIFEEENKNQIIEVVTRRSNSIDIVRNDINKIHEINTNLNNKELNNQTRDNLTNE
jgi:hypothetical protein